jgi:two-component system nitrate/nitrite response regulator NarL
MRPPAQPPDPEQPSSTPVRVLLVEDHGMVAEAIGLAFDATKDLDVVATSQSVADGVIEAARHRPDVVVLDRRLPDGDGVAAMPRLRKAAPEARVLVLTGEASAAVAARVAEAGADGLMLKSSKLDDLATAVRRVADGEAVFDAGLLSLVPDNLTGPTGPVGTTLTRREREALHLLAEGVSTGEMTVRLGVSYNTVRNHVQRILAKLGARSKLEAVAIARRGGLVD